MSIYTILMVAFAVIAIICRPGIRSKWIIAAFCLPFLSVPGLSDVAYVPLEPNSPIVGGFLAFIIATLITRAAKKSWHFWVAASLGVMLLWNSTRAFGMIDMHTHAFGLEAIFYTAILTAILAPGTLIWNAPKWLARSTRRIAVLCRLVG